jgi:hypothetical protein
MPAASTAPQFPSSARLARRIGNQGLGSLVVVAVASHPMEDGPVHWVSREMESVLNLYDVVCNGVPARVQYGARRRQFRCIAMRETVHADRPLSAERTKWRPSSTGADDDRLAPASAFVMPFARLQRLEPEFGAIGLPFFQDFFNFA